MNTGSKQVVVIGAGIVGASIAFNLAIRGARVILVDRAQPASGVTGRSFAWLNSSHGVVTENAPLRQQALAEFRHLQQQLNNRLKVNWCGALTWYAEPSATERFVSEYARLGDAVRLVDASEISELEPALLDPPNCAAYAADEGAIDPVGVTNLLVNAALENGARFKQASEVSGFVTRGTRVVAVKCGENQLNADVVVLAAGVETGRLCSSIGISLPVKASPAILIRLKTSGRLVKRIISNPDFEIRQCSNSTMLAAEDYIDDSADNGPDAIASRSLSAIQKGLSGGESVVLDAVTVGVRPVPEDGLPIIGFCPGIQNLYIASMHAGITLAPVVGRYSAQEILNQQEVDALKSCRLQRFNNQSVT